MGAFTIEVKDLKTIEYAIDKIIRLTKTHWQVFASPIHEAVNYHAGQYLFVRYPQGNFLPFSIANAPNNQHQIELHIRSNPSDQDSHNFLEKIATLKKITLTAPLGNCYYQEKNDPLLLLAAGTGFAPAKAIIEDMIIKQIKRPCFLYWTVKQPDDFYLPTLPVHFQKLLPDFHYTPICTQVNLSGNLNNILSAVLQDFESLSACQVYVFGPKNLATDALSLFIDNGLKREDFYSDVL